MTSIHSISLGVTDVAAAEKFYSAAFELDGRLRLEHNDEPTSGFRGFSISLIVSQPANASAIFDAAVAAGATVIKPMNSSLWGVGGVIQAPDGAIWKIATSAKKDTTPASKAIDSMVVLTAASDVSATKKFYVDHGLKVGKSFGKYVEFDLPQSPVKFGLYSTKALAKDAGVAPEGSGSHRVSIVSDATPFTDPDGFAWQSV
jgi:hypothetical protein